MANSRYKFGSNPAAGGCVACDAENDSAHTRGIEPAMDWLPISKLFIAGLFPGVASDAPSERPPVHP
jgi:hypothetical protein